ncbi:uncharacterized protein LOC129980794 [Argiope bruennichi]|uniref:uncharacterized protein LOC129980794 n=1 Tax=Argiope bruennichi TaxID=94029 RepID=UPI00249582B2|nr:uncharacterized protein LOC129980794 [Argiope bruennichi]
MANWVNGKKKLFNASSRCHGASADSTSLVPILATSLSEANSGSTLKSTGLPRKRWLSKSCRETSGTPPMGKEVSLVPAVSPFLVQKAINATVGEVASIRKMRSGDLLVEVSSRKQAQQIQKLESLATIRVSVTPHQSLNSSKGVITCGEILNLPVELIASEMKSQGVSHVRRISIRRDGQLLETKHHVLTFKTSKLPEYVYAGYIKLPVRPYIPNPLRCFQCQRFGHSKMNCRGSLTCARCAQKGHDSQQCTAEEKCVNCGGDHPSYSRSCPRWALEKQVTTIKFKEDLSYPEARRRVKAQTPTPLFQRVHHV